MCTIITREQMAHSIIAKKDFIVYKIGMEHKLLPGVFMSIYLNHEYHTNTQYHVTMTYNNIGSPCDTRERDYMNTIPEDQRIFVVEGIHSFATLARLKEGWLWKDKRIAEFIVPKDARYYINGSNNIVSSDIIFKQFIL